MNSELHKVETLIKGYEDAIAHHDKLFAGDGTDAECAAALGPISEGLIAICAARPSSDEGRQRRREYLSARLFIDTDGCAGLIKAVFEALLDEPVETVDSGEKSP